jgi:single-stranded DNA-binding protein
MIDALTRGRLVADPERKLTKAGKSYATARLSVTDRESEHLVLATAFDDEAVRALLALAKGDALVVAGELSIGVWTPPEGKEPRASLRVLVHRVLTPYAVQRRREAASGARRDRDLAGRNQDAKGR